MEEDNQETKLLPILEWIAANREHVRVSKNIDVVRKTSTNEKDADRSIFAEHEVQDREVVVELQPNVVLNATNTINITLAEFLKDKKVDLQEIRKQMQSLSATCKQVACLLMECALGDKSRFFKYIQQLPKAIPLPMMWNQSERELLVHSAAYSITDYELVNNMYERFFSPLARKYPSVWPAKFSALERFKWAYAIVSSRAFGTSKGLKEPTLLPVIDMANHHPSLANTAIRTDEANKTFKLVALRRISKGEPLVISYGNLSSAQLLCRYGFVLENDIAADTIPITEQMVLQAYEQLKDDDDDSVLYDDEDNDEDHDHDEDDEDDEDDDEFDEGNDDDDEPKRKKRKKAASKGSKQPQKSAHSKAQQQQQHGDDEQNEKQVFYLCADPAQDFGISEAFVDFIVKHKFTEDLVYDALAVILQQKDKNYCGILDQLDHRPADQVTVETAVAMGLVRQIIRIERNICRKVLLELVAELATNGY